MTNRAQKQAARHKREARRDARLRRKKRADDVKSLLRVKPQKLWARIYETVDATDGVRGHLTKVDLSTHEVFRNFRDTHWDSLDKSADGVITHDEWFAFGEVLIEEEGYSAFRDTIATLIFGSHGAVDCEDLIVDAKKREVEQSGLKMVSDARLVDRIFDEIDSDDSARISRKEVEHSDFADALLPHWNQLIAVVPRGSEYTEACIDRTAWHEWFTSIGEKHGAEEKRRLLVDLLWDSDCSLKDLVMEAELLLQKAEGCEGKTAKRSARTTNTGPKQGCEISSCLVA
jgi:hypothetical protein